MASARFLRLLTPVGGWPTTTPTFGTFAINAANSGLSWLFQAKTTDPITHLGFRASTRVGTPPTYIIGLEGFSASTGFADGVYKTNGGNCSGTFTPPASTAWDNTIQWVALANTYTPTLGELLCPVVRYSSGTIDASNCLNFSPSVANIGTPTNVFPYHARLTAGAWAMNTAWPMFGYRTANGRFGHIYQTFYSTRSASTVGNRVAAKINLPSGFGSTYRVAGFRACASIAAAVGKNPIARIWSSSGPLASETLDSDLHASAASGAYRVIECYFESSVTLSFGTDYYFGFEVADAVSGGVILYGTQYAEAADKASEDGGDLIRFSSFNGTSWTDDATIRPWMELILDDWTAVAGASGGCPLVGNGGLVY